MADMTRYEEYQAYLEATLAAGGIPRTFNEWMRQFQGGSPVPTNPYQPVAPITNGGDVSVSVESINGYDYEVSTDPTTGEKYYDRIGRTSSEESDALTANAKQEGEQWNRQFEYNTSQDTADRAYRDRQLDNDYALARDQLAWEKTQFGATQALQEKQFALDQWYQEQKLAQTDRQMGLDEAASLAQLRANPVNWIQVDERTGQSTLAQPWMMPMGLKDYGKSVGDVLINRNGIPLANKLPGAYAAAPAPAPSPAPAPAPASIPTGSPAGPAGAPPQLTRTSNPDQQRAAIDQVIAGGNFPDPAVRENLATTWQGNYQNAIRNPVVAPPIEEPLPLTDPRQIDLPPGYEQYAGYARGGQARGPQAMIVGEQGPEVELLPKGQQRTVIPMDRMDPRMRSAMMMSTMPRMATGGMYDDGQVNPLPYRDNRMEVLPGGNPLPQLGTPSTQYLARMGPTARGQYAGYEQYRTGISPEELEYRLWSMAPPSGANRGFSYRR